MKLTHPILFAASALVTSVLATTEIIVYNSADCSGAGVYKDFETIDQAYSPCLTNNKVKHSARYASRDGLCYIYAYTDSACTQGKQYIGPQCVTGGNFMSMNAFCGLKTPIVPPGPIEP